jgi:hypothetical protein
MEEYEYSYIKDPLNKTFLHQNRFNSITTPYKSDTQEQK